MTIDERLEFLVQSTESLHASCQELHATVQRQAEENEKLWSRNEARWEKVRKIVRAALDAAQSDDGGNGHGN